MGQMYKTLIYDGQISLSVLDTTDIVNKATEYHKLSPLAAAGLGRALTVGSFMSTSLKNENEKLSITISGNGVGGKIVVAADGNFNVRGSILNPQTDLPLKPNGKLDVGGLVGNDGFITVVKDLGLKEPYVGKCRLVSGEIGEDFAAYFAYSEQQPTAIAVGVLIKNYKCIGAGGVILQPLPDCSEEALEKAEKLIGEFSDVSKKISEVGASGIIEKYFTEYDFTEYKTEYKCGCSKKYVDKVLISLGRNEFSDIIDKEGKIEVSCEFCNKKYVYGKNDEERLFGTQNGGKNS